MCRKTQELSRGEKFMGSLIFHLIVIVKDIYPSKSRNMCGQIITFNHKLFHIFNYAEITKYYKLVGPDLILLQSFGCSTESHTQKLELQLLFLSFSHPQFLCLSICLVTNLIYNILLLFIGNLKITSTWIDWLSIKDYNNYLPKNLASEINLTGLHCRIMDSPLLSDWLTRYWVI